MWMKRKKNKDMVTIVCIPDGIICSWFSQEKNKKPRLLAHQRYLLPHHEFIAGKISNFSHLKKYINTFCTHHAISQAPCVIAVAEESAQQSLVYLPKASPSARDFNHRELPSTTSQYIYLYPRDESFAFYSVVIAQPIMFQYMLLVRQTQLDLTHVTTAMMAHLKLYRELYGTTFRTSQLALDMQRTQNQLHTHFNEDMLHRMLHIQAPINVAEHTSTLITSFGLYLVGKHS